MPPLVHLAAVLAAGTNITIEALIGARTASMLVGTDELARRGVSVSTATDDGSAGHHGPITELLRPLLASHTDMVEGGQLFVAACGPAAMERAVCDLVIDAGVRAEIAMEEPMACGFGVCLGCALEVRDDDGTRFAMVCREGPVFDARAIVWDDRHVGGRH